MKIDLSNMPSRIIIAAPRTSLLPQLELLFKPLLCGFINLSRSPQAQASRKSSLLALVMTVLILTSLFCKAALLVLSLTRGIEHASIRRVSSCVRLTCSAVIMTLLIRRSHDITVFRYRLLSLYRRLPFLDPSSLRLGRTKLIIWFTAACLCLEIGYTTFQGFLSDTDDASLTAYFKELWFGLDPKRHFSSSFARFLWNVESFVFTVTTDGVVYASSLFYVTACLLLEARLRDFRLSLGRQRWEHAHFTTTPKTLSPRVLHDLQRIHEVLTEAAQQLEDIFSPIIFCAYVSCLVHLVTDLYKFFDRNLLYFSGAPDKISWVRHFMTYFEFGLAVWFFLLLSAAGAVVNEESPRTLPAVEKMVLEADELPVASSFRASFLLARFSRPFVQLTAWKVFVISRSFVFTVMGAILTYGVIALQFVHLGNEPADR